MTDTKRTFRISLIRLWLDAAILHGAFTLLIMGCIALAGRQANWLYLALFAVAPALIWIIYGLTFRVTVSPDGLGWTTIDGENEFAKWDEIEGASPGGFPLLPMVGIELARGRRSGFLLILSDLPGFGDALREHAGADHPLTRAVTGEVG